MYSKHIIEASATSGFRHSTPLRGQLTGRRDADRLAQHVRCAAFFFLYVKKAPRRLRRGAISHVSPAPFALCFSHPTPAHLILFTFLSLCAASKAPAWRCYSTNNEQKKRKKKLKAALLSPQFAPLHKLWKGRKLVDVLGANLGEVHVPLWHHKGTTPTGATLISKELLCETRPLCY